jgi:hypothetical protein
VSRLAVALAALAFVPAAAAAYGPAKQVGTITSPALPEISGMTAASVVRGGWWVENDSGNTPDLHLISGKGKLLATVRVRGATNVDWEDLASVPAANGRRTLYLADIGDNDHVRDDLVVYRIAEPSRRARSVAATALPFRYPDGRHDAEALFVDPASGRIYVLTKTLDTNAEPCRLYRFPLPLRPGTRVTLERVGGRFAKLVAPVQVVTGAAVSPDGTRLAIRTYFDAWEFHSRAGSPFASVFEAPFEHIVLPLERQGESIAYTSDGKALETTSEKLPAPIWRLSRR